MNLACHSSSTVVLLAGMLFACPASSQINQSTNSEASAIRSEMKQMQQDYERRIQELEKRLEQVETKTQSTNTPRQSNAGTNANRPEGVAEQYRTFANEQFRQDTESRDWALTQEQNRPFKERMDQVLNNFIEIGGYFRGGYGRDSEGGPQPGFQAPGAFAKYRLGNEAENYGEIAFDKKWYAPELFSGNPDVRPDGTPTGPIARTVVRLALYDPYPSSGSTSGFQTSLPEAWAEIGNVFASQPSLKFWAGKRFYRRQDIHINDFFFYNMSGAGGGFEDLELPFGKLALAWIGNGAQSGVYSDIVAQPDPANLAGFSKQNFDLSLYDVPVPLGKAEFAVVGAMQNSGQDSLGRQAPDTSGVALTAIHSHEHFLSDDGINKLSLQFGTGSAKTFTSGFETTSLTNGTFIIPDEQGSWRVRMTESFVTQPWTHLSVSPALVYQYTDYKDVQGTRHWVSAGVRPIYHFNKYISLAFEGGADYVDDTGLDQHGTLYKFTLAPQVSMGGGFFSRPVIRAFVTYANWTKSFAGQIGGNDYANHTSAWTWGFQMESWW